MENQPQKERKITLGLIISWGLGTLSGLSGIAMLFSDPLPSTILILTSLVLLPPVNQFIKEKYSFALSGGVKVVVVLILFTTAGSFMSVEDIATGSIVDNTVVTPPASDVAKKSPKQKQLEVVDVSTKITEQNSMWWRYSWNLTLKNNTSRNRTTMAEIKWVDADGFVIDSAHEFSLEVPSNSEKTFNGYSLIQTPGAGDVESVQAELSGF